jgi:hypothetical protein
MLTDKAKIKLLECRVVKLEQAINYLFNDVIGCDGVSTWEQMMEREKLKCEEKKEQDGATEQLLTDYCRTNHSNA